MPLPLTGERTVPRLPEENYWFRRHLAAYRFAARLVRGRVVDAGAGEGYGAAMLSRRATVIGLDLDAGAVAHAAGTYPALRFVRADACRLPVADASVDAVVALQVIEHLHCAEEFVAACRRVLRPSGTMILSTPNRATFPAGLNRFHVHEYEADELRAAAARHFEDVTILGLEHRAPLAQLDRVLGEAVQSRLVRVSYAAQPWWLRAILPTVTSRDFRVTHRPERALDLLARATIGG